MKNFYFGSYKILKEIKEDLDEIKDIPCSWTRGKNMMLMPLKLMKKFKAVSIKILVIPFGRSWKSDSEFNM